MTNYIEIYRQSDGRGLYLHFTGGFRAARLAENEWQIEPIFVNGSPHAEKSLTKNQVQEITRKNKLHALAFHSFGWRNGEYYSSWAPIVLSKNNHFESPAEMWGNIAGNIAETRAGDLLRSASHLDVTEIAGILDDQSPVEALAGYISRSLACMDISLEHISEHYNEQLVNHMVRGRVDGERSSNTLSSSLYAHIHSFFLHLGAARDYLGALIAHRIGFDHAKTDSMARLIGELRQAKAPSDALLNLLIEDGDISPHTLKPGRFSVSGWMQEVTEIRNDFVHKRPYGSKFDECFGWAVPLQQEIGLYRYFRPIDINGSAEQDVLDVLHYHYTRCTTLLHRAAIASGYNADMARITEDDVVSLEISLGNEVDLPGQILP